MNHSIRRALASNSRVSTAPLCCRALTVFSSEEFARVVGGRCGNKSGPIAEKGTLCVLADEAMLSCMEPMRIDVISARLNGKTVHATVRAFSPPTADIHLRLQFPIASSANIWTAARDEALRFLDVR